MSTPSVDHTPASTNAVEPAAASSRYSRVAIVLHWAIAALVLSTIPLGWFSTSSQGAPARPGSPPQGTPMAQPATTSQAASVPQAATTPPAGATPPSASGAPRGPAPPPKTAAQQSATNLHKTVGVVILALTVLRIGWRLGHKPPALPAGMARLLRWLARTSHALFYALLVAMPVSGWWMSSAVPTPRRHAFGFGLFDIPFLPVEQGWAAASQARFIHTNLVWLMVGLIVLHVAAALKHHWLDKDDVLRRMLPRRS